MRKTEESAMGTIHYQGRYKMGQKYIEDEYGVLYSEDGAVLLGYNREVFHCAEYRIKDGVKILAANAFHNCQHLKSIFMPDSVIEDKGSIFEGSKSLEEARVSVNLKNPGIAMFSGCSSLRYVELQEGLESIGENMFYGCTALKHIALPSTILYLFGDTFCASCIEDIVLHEGLKEIGHDAFNGCYHLKKLVIPSTVEHIGSWLVQGHKEFEGITCKSSKFRVEDEALISNEEDSLLACWTKMTEYHLPASVKNIRSVLNNQIETLYVDNPLDEIGFEAFIGCSSLKKIAYNATVRINKSANFSWARD